MINPVTALLDWWHERQPAVFGPLHRFNHLARLTDPDTYDIADDRRAELLALDNISDGIDALTALVEDIRNTINHGVPCVQGPAQPEGST